jgi:hypothetical protein
MDGEFGNIIFDLDSHSDWIAGRQWAGDGCQRW